MDSWVYAVAGAAVLATVLVCARGARRARRVRTELRSELSVARADVRSLTERVEALSDEVARTGLATEELRRQELAPLVITGVVDNESAAAQRDAQLVHTIEVGRPVWVPGGALREALVKSLALAHGLHRALSADNRDRIRLEMQAEVRRSRRQRKTEIKALRKYLRERRTPAA